jgi:hypothetical protein
VKLNPQRVLSHSADLAQSQVTIVSDLSDSETRTIERAGHDASRTAAAFAEHEIAEPIATPYGRRLQNAIGGDVFPTGRRI